MFIQENLFSKHEYKEIKPFLKWAGGKFRIKDKIIKKLPSAKTLVEPFVGSGAIFLNSNYDEYILSDSNHHLIDLYNIVKTDKNEFIDFALQFFIDENNTEEAFYKFRAQFNETDCLYTRSALFIYLNRHCFNGLCRYNSKGQYNVPFGRYKKPYFPYQELIDFSKKSERATFIHADFREAMSKIPTYSVVYCDPPYVALNATSNFSDYTSSGFNDKDQQDLADLAHSLKSQNIPVIISNHDTDFTRTIYEKASVFAFEVQRFISSKGDDRKKAPELIACF